ncbi:MAG: Ribosome association toxin RatA [Pseudomonadota bacterium]
MATVSKSVLVPYSAQRMFDLVERVEDYPGFLPWCSGSSVSQRNSAGMTATVQIDFKGLRQSFTTVNHHEPGRQIDMRLKDGPFSRLQGTWRFIPLREDACKVSFELDYAFAGGLISRMLSPVFDQIAGSMVDAFVKRADQLHGTDHHG